MYIHSCTIPVPVRRGDIVILHQPDSPNDLICKRITQVAGDRIPQSHHALHKISVVTRAHTSVCGCGHCMLLLRIRRFLVATCGWKVTVNTCHMTLGISDQFH